MVISRIVDAVWVCSYLPFFSFFSLLSFSIAVVIWLTLDSSCFGEMLEDCIGCGFLIVVLSLNIHSVINSESRRAQLQ